MFRLVPNCKEGHSFADPLRKLASALIRLVHEMGHPSSLYLKEEVLPNAMAMSAERA